MNRFAELEVFVAVAETGSFSAAANRQGIAISAVSRRVDELEARLGTKLTFRSTQGVKLTREGRVYYDRCLRLLADLREADGTVSGFDVPASGLIRIACPPAFCLNYLAPLANEHALANPGIRFDIDMSDRVVDLIEEGFDFAIRLGRIDDPALTSEPLFPVRHLVTASPQFWNTHGRPKQPEDLADFPALVYRSGPNPAIWHFTHTDGAKSEVRLAPRFMANNGTILVEAARSGLGVCLEPEFVCAAAVADGTLEPVLEDYRAFEGMAELAHPKTRPMSKRAAGFAELLRDRINEQMV